MLRLPVRDHPENRGCGGGSSKQSVPGPGCERRGQLSAGRERQVCGPETPRQKGRVLTAGAGAGLRVGAKWGCPGGPPPEPVLHS